MRDSQCAEPLRHPSGATSPFRRGKTEVAPTEHYNAIAGEGSKTEGFTPPDKV